MALFEAGSTETKAEVLVVSHWSRHFGCVLTVLPWQGVLALFPFLLSSPLLVFICSLFIFALPREPGRQGPLGTLNQMGLSDPGPVCQRPNQNPAQLCPKLGPFWCHREVKIPKPGAQVRVEQTEEGTGYVHTAQGAGSSCSQAAQIYSGPQLGSACQQNNRSSCVNPNPSESCFLWNPQ